MEFESDQDEFWLPPDKRRSLLLMFGVKQPDILSEVSVLDHLRADRQKSVSDKDALAFAIALHQGIPEDVVLRRLCRPPPPHRTLSKNLKHSQDKSEMLGGLSLGTATHIMMKVKAKARRACARVAATNEVLRKRRSSMAGTQARGIRSRSGSSTAMEVDLMTLGEEKEEEDKSDSGGGRGAGNKLTVMYDDQEEEADVQIDMSGFGGIELNPRSPLAPERVLEEAEEEEKAGRAEQQRQQHIRRQLK